MNMGITEIISLGVIAAVAVLMLAASAGRKRKRGKGSGPKGTETPAEAAEGKDNKKSKRAEKSPSKGKLKEITSTQEMSGLVDVRDGIAITKYGYYKILEFTPINFTLLSAEEQNVIVSKYSAIIRTWPETVHIKIVSAKSNLQPFIDDLERAKKREREQENKGCVSLINDQIELIGKLQNQSGMSRRFFVVLKYENPGGFKKTPPFEEVVSSLNSEARTISAALESCGNTLISSDTRDYVLSVFYLVINKASSDEYPYEDRKKDILLKYRTANRGVPVPVEKIPVNDFIAPAVKVDSSLSPNYLYVDGKYITYCYIPADAYPSYCVGGWLALLFSYMDGVDVDFWIKKENPESVQRKLSLALKNNKIKRRQTDDTSQDYEDIEASVEAGYYIKSALAAGDDFCYMATIITITADSPEELGDRYTAYRNHLIRNDLSLRRLSFQQEEAFRICLPTVEYNEQIFNKSKRNIMSSMLGSSYPFTAFELRDKNGIFLGINDQFGSPVFINSFDTKQYQNSNMMILGPSGSGKSFALMCMLLRMRQRGLQVFVISPLKAIEFYRACSNIDGEYIRIAPGSAQNINIMEIRKRDTGSSELIDGVGESFTGSLVTSKVQQVSRFFTLLLPDISVEEKTILDECLVKTYERFGMNTRSNKSLIDPKSPTGAYKTMPILGDLLKTLEDYDRAEGGSSCKRLRAALTKFVSGSASSFNAQTNVKLDNKYIVFNVEDLGEDMLPIGMFICLDFVLDKAKQDRTKRKIIAIDEMWQLMQASKMSADFVVEIFKVIRGYGGAAWGATQQLSDVLNDENGAAVINNAKLKLFYPMDKDDLKAACNVVELTENEKEKLRRTAIGSSDSGRRALMVANSNHVFVRIKATDREFDLITTDATELERLKKDMMAKTGMSEEEEL